MGTVVRSQGPAKTQVSHLRCMPDTGTAVGVNKALTPHGVVSLRDALRESQLWSNPEN